MSFIFRLLPESLTLTIEYNTDLFTKGRIKRLARLFENVLETVTAHPTIALPEINFLSNDEEEYFNQIFQSFRPVFPESETLNSLFYNQAQLFSEDKIALRLGSDSLTYQELNNQSNQLAHLLLDRGVEHNNFIGVFMDRSMETPIKLLEQLIFTILSVESLSLVF